MEAYNPPEYGAPPESCREECEKLCKDKTVNELRQISDYFSKEARDLDEKLSSTITNEDFEKVKKDYDEDEQDKEPQTDNDGKGYNESL